MLNSNLQNHALSPGSISVAVVNIAMAANVNEITQILTGPCNHVTVISNVLPVLSAVDGTHNWRSCMSRTIDGAAN